MKSIDILYLYGLGLDVEFVWWNK